MVELRCVTVFVGVVAKPGDTVLVLTLAFLAGYVSANLASGLFVVGLLFL